MSSIPVFDISNPLGGLMDQAVAMGYVNEKRTTTKDAIASFEDNIEHAVSVKADIDPTLDGVSAVNVAITGKNLLDISQFAKDFPNNCSFENDILTINQTSTTLYNRGIAVFIPAGSILSAIITDITSVNARFRLVYKDGSTSDVYPSDLPFAINKDLSSVRLNWSTAGKFTIKNAQIEIGTTSTAYESYTGTTSAISLGSTVYGGSVSVSEEGEVELTTTYAPYSFTGAEEWTLDTDETYFETELDLGTAVFTDDSAYMTSNSIILRLQDDGKTIRAYLADNESLTAESDMNEVFTNTDKLVYELATSSSTDLTDIDPIETRVSENNIWADTGDIEVGYYYQLYQPI